MLHVVGWQALRRYYAYKSSLCIRYRVFYVHREGLVEVHREAIRVRKLDAVIFKLVQNTPFPWYHSLRKYSHRLMLTLESKIVLRFRVVHRCRLLRDLKEEKGRKEMATTTYISIGQKRNSRGC